MFFTTLILSLILCWFIYDLWIFIFVIGFISIVVNYQKSNQLLFFNNAIKSLIVEPKFSNFFVKLRGQKRKKYYFLLQNLINKIDQYVYEQNLLELSLLIGKDNSKEVISETDLELLDADLILFCEENKKRFQLKELKAKKQLSTFITQQLIKNLEFIYINHKQKIYPVDIREHSVVSELAYACLYRFDVNWTEHRKNRDFKGHLWIAFKEDYHSNVNTFLKCKKFVETFTVNYVQTNKIINLKNKVVNSRKSSMQKNQFISGLSHDLRSPINNLNAINKCLIDSCNDQENQELLLLANSNLKLLNDLVEDLLSLTQFRAGNLKLNFNKINVYQELIDLRMAFLFYAKLKKLSIDIDINQKVLMIEADRIYFKRIFSNILNNAIKYTEQGRIKIKAESSSAKELIISIQDTGVGLKPEQIDQICRPFIRFSDQEIQGIGLGLAVTKLMIKLHNGKFDIKSKKGIGSEFKVTLPVHQQKSELISDKAA